MPNSADLNRILTDTGPFQAEYKPVQTSQGNPAPKPSECNLPEFEDDPLVLTPYEPPVITKECLNPFIPTPVVPPPYIDVSDLESPCAPDGFQFRSNDVGTGTIAYDQSVSGSIGPDTVYPVLGTATMFLTEIQEITDAGAPMPQLEVEVSGETYLARVHTVGNDTQLYLREKFQKTDGTLLMGAQTGLAYTIKRIVFTTDSSRPTSGEMKFIKTDVIGCEGAFVGEVNLDLSVSVPCPNGPTVVNTVNGSVDPAEDSWKVPVRNALIPNSDPRHLQSFGYETTSAPCEITLNLERGTEIILPDVEVVLTTSENNALPDTVTLTKTYSNAQNKITFSGTIRRGGAGGGGGGSQCCVWQ